MKVSAEEIERYRKEIMEMVDEKLKPLVAKMDIWFEEPKSWVRQKLRMVKFERKVSSYTCTMVFSGLLLVGALLLPEDAFNSFGGEDRLLPNDAGITKTLTMFYYDLASQGLSFPDASVRPDDEAKFVDLVYPTPTLIPNTGLRYPIQNVLMPFPMVSGISGINDYIPKSA